MVMTKEWPHIYIPATLVTLTLTVNKKHKGKGQTFVLEVVFLDH